MNTKGTSLVLYVLLEIAVLLMYMFAMYSFLGGVDVDYFQKTTLVQNLGMATSTISFLPGSSAYAYPTSQDTVAIRWLKELALVVVQTDTTFKYKSLGDTAEDSYPFIFNQEKPIEKEEIVLQEGALQISSRPNGILLNAPVMHTQLRCEPGDYAFTWHSAYGGEEDKLYRDGEELGSKNEAKVVYENFDAHYLAGDVEGFVANPGSEYTRGVVFDILTVLSVKKELAYFHKQELHEDALILSLSQEPNNYVIGYYAHESAKGEMCKLVQALLLSGEFEGGNIVPTRDTYSSLVLGRGNDPTVYTSLRKENIAKAIMGESS